MHSTTLLRYMRFFRRTISMDINNTEWKMMKDSGKGVLCFLGSSIPAKQFKNTNVFKQLFQDVHEQTNYLVDEILSHSESKAPEQCSTLELLDNLSNLICCAADLTDCVRCMHPNSKYKDAAAECMRSFTALVETLNTTPELYFALKRSLVTEAFLLNPIAVRTANLLLQDFELSGVLLADSERQRFVQLSDEIFDAGTRFVAGSDRPTKINDERKILSPVIGDTELLFAPLCQHKNGKIRQFTYEKFYQHDEQQELLLKRLISARHQIAQLTNFPTFAHRAQINSILCTYENVHKFLENIIEGFSSQIDSELEQILQITTDYSSHDSFDIEGQVGYADVEFATSIRRRQLIEKMDGSESLSKFFHFGTMLDGFELIVQKLYGISFKRSLPNEGECWEGNVLKLQVYREDEHNSNSQIFLGDIFIDVDARPSKLQGDCHFTVRCSKLLENGEFQTPIVVVSLAINQTDSNHFQASSCSISNLLDELEMSPQQAENFFHEMGHAMHSILGRTIFQHVAGTRCPTDFAEIPSHLMECFFNDSRILQKICRDKSGRIMDNEQASTIIKCRRIFPAIHNTQQAIFSLFDLEVHGEHAEDISYQKISTTDLCLQLHKKALPRLYTSSNYAYHHRISHLVTYGAKYYSYLLARASASLIFDNLFDTNLLGRENGQKWANVQSYGGEYPSDVLLAKALGTPNAPSSEQLTYALINDATNVK